MQSNEVGHEQIQANGNEFDEQWNSCVTSSTNTMEENKTYTKEEHGETDNV